MTTLKQDVNLVVTATRSAISHKRFFEVTILSVMVIGFTGYLCNKYAPQLVGVKRLIRG